MHSSESPRADSRPSLPDDRLSELKARVSSDYYDTPEVVYALAGQILKSGDLDLPTD